MLRDFIENIRNGTRLALFQEVRYEEFRVDAVQLVLLLTVHTALMAANDQIPAATDPEAMQVGWDDPLLHLLGLVVGASLIALIQGVPGRIIGTLVVVTSANFVVLLVLAAFLALTLLDLPFASEEDLAFDLSATGLILILGGVVAGFSLVVDFRAVRCSFDVGAGRAFLLFLLLTACWLAPGFIADGLG